MKTFVILHVNSILLLKENEDSVRYDLECDNYHNINNIRQNGPELKSEVKPKGGLKINFVLNTKLAPDNSINCKETLFCKEGNVFFDTGQYRHRRKLSYFAWCET